GQRLFAEVLSDRRKTGILHEFKSAHTTAKLVGQARDLEAKFFLDLERWAAGEGRRSESGDPLDAVLRVRTPGAWTDVAAPVLENLAQELRELIPQAKTKE